MPQASLPDTEQQTYTFYYECYCDQCRRAVHVPTQRRADEIPKNKREDVLAQVASGVKLTWPYDPATEEEAEQVAASGSCPNNPSHKLEYVWNIGAG